MFPYGRYKNPKIVDVDLLYQISEYLNENDIEILAKRICEAVKDAQTDDFVYFDPPYIPLNQTSSFYLLYPRGLSYGSGSGLRKYFKKLTGEESMLCCQIPRVPLEELIQGFQYLFCGSSAN